MILFLIGHGIEPIHIFLRFAVHIVQFFVAVDRRRGRHLQYDGHLGVAEDVNVLKFRPELELRHILRGRRGAVADNAVHHDVLTQSGGADRQLQGVDEEGEMKGRWHSNDLHG